MKRNKHRRKRIIKRSKLAIILGILVIIFSLFIQAYNETKPAEANLTYTEFKNMLDNEKISKAQIISNSDTFTITDTDGNEYEVINPKYDDFRKDLLEQGVEIEVRKTSLASSISSVMVTIPVTIMMFIICLLLLQQMGRTTGSNFRLLKNEDTVTFDDVAGLKEIKTEVQFAIDTLKYHNELSNVGCRPTRGIILEGPPGTGKTLIAKAIAGEAKVPFISTSGSDFIEMFAGLGAARVRGLWQLASENAPCVIFIDEIDAVGRRRQSANSGAQMESNQTLNAILQKMDGLGNNSGILVIGATNMISDLDPALLRPGRFDKKIYVGPPKTKESRDEIIKLHLKNKVMEEDTEFDDVSKAMFGLTGAEIESTLNEAVMISIQNHRNGVINYSDIDEAVMKLRVSGVVVNNYTEKDRYVAAVHEAGHAIMNLILGRNVSKVSITAYSSGVGGVTVTDVDSKVNQFKFKSELTSDLKILLAGMIAERIIFGENSVGCSNDLERSTELAKSMVFKWGMTNNTLVNIDKLGENSVVQGKSEVEIEEVNVLLKSIANDTWNSLSERERDIRELADRLMKEETIINLDSKIFIDIN